jgi:predicted permease
MIAFPGALVGIALAWLAGPWLVHLLGSSHQDKISLSMQPNTVVLSVTAACAMVCALLFGMAPAWAAGHTNVESALRGTRSRVAPGSSGVRRFFVPFQVALSLVLVVVAALLGSTLVHLRTGASGYRTENVVFYITDFNRIPQKGAAAVLPLYRRIIARMNTIPGTVSASVVQAPPLFDQADSGKFVAAEAGPHAQATESLLNSVGAGFFTTVGTPFVVGRDLRNDETDADSCILNQAAAAKFFPKANPLGRMLRQVPYEMDDPAETPHTCQVIGIVQNAKYYTLLQEFEPIVYVPLSVRTRGITGLFLVIHGRSAAAAEAAQHTALQEIAPTAPESDPIRFSDMFNDSIARERLLSSLSGFFAGLALLLSGIGIYGLVAWNVTQRTMEIGVRMALGATRMRVFMLVMRQVAVLLAVGVVAGGIGAFFAARSIRSFLFEVQPGDLGIFAMAALALALIGLLATLVPARRAVSIDPVGVLRTE